MLCLGATSIKGSVIYVNRSAVGPFDGLTWTTAFTNVSQGLSQAGVGDQVWVASGTYFERIVINDGVALYGGFAGGEINLSQRNWSLNLTILDGNQGGSVVTFASGAGNP